MKLLPKIIIGYIIFGILSFTVVATFTAHKNQLYLYDHIAAELKRDASAVAAQYHAYIQNDNLSISVFEKHLKTAGSYKNADIFIIDQNGTILMSYAPGAALGDTHVLKDFDILDFSNGYYTISTMYSIFKEPMLCIYTPVTSDYQPDGYVIICQQISYIRQMQSSLLDIGYLTLLIVYLISFLILVIYIFFVHRPMKKIIQAAQHYNDGDYTWPLSVRSNGELHYIAASFNYMTHELGTLGEDQRKFVSNISHDFRSPLTSIKGYAQAINDGTIPPELQSKYLGVIIFETERLEKLTQNLLELNKYGSQGFLLDISSFDLNRCIKMAVDPFAQISREKQISFNLILTGNELYVDADESRIHQVLQNLIDNAIKFSHPESTVEIETTVKKDRVFISVRDHGMGIPKDSLSKIWERFYKTDPSRGRDKKGTGLGLSIVREIIHAHKENINVISTEGVGSEFIFTLPLSLHRQ